MNRTLLTPPARSRLGLPALALGTAALLATGCGEHPASPGAAGHAATALSAVAAVLPAAQAAPAARADAPVKLLNGNDQFAATLARGALAEPPAYHRVDATGGRQFAGPEIARQRALLRDLYWSRTPFDATALAADALPEVAREPDSFKRADLAKARRAELLAMHQAAAAFRRVAVLDSRGTGLTVLPYDAGSGSFRANFSGQAPQVVSFAKADGQRAVWELGLLGTEPSPGTDGRARMQLQHRPADEAAARRIEAEVVAAARGTGAANLPVLYQGEVIHTRADGLRSLAVVRVDAVSVLTRDAQQVLFTFDRRALGETIWVEHGTAATLGLLAKPGN